MSVKVILNKLDKEKLEIVSVLRDLIQKKKLEESIKWRHLTYSGNKTICSIIPHKNHVNLHFFRGAHLQDPKNRLEGNGKNLRHVKIRSVDSIDRSYVNQLLDEAIRLDSGKGS